MTEREILIKKISTYSFAAYDLHLYLNTHPNDPTIERKRAEYLDKARGLIKEYEERFGPLTPAETDSDSWAWIQGPWPWERED